MTTTTIELTCRDPIISRDSRPFGWQQGNRMRPVAWPIPSVVAGSLRTAVAKEAQREFSETTSNDLLQVAVGGLFPAVDGRLYLPAPADCVVHEDGRVLRARPEEVIEGAGCDWPEDDLLPVMVPLDPAEEDFKAKKGPDWWPSDRLAHWLTGQDTQFDHTFLKAPEIEERTHVQLNPETGSSQEAMLFTTAALSLTHLPRYQDSAESEGLARRVNAIRLVTRAAADGWAGETLLGLNVLHPLGGERRLVLWKANPDTDWSCPGPVAEALGRTERVRMVLATPGIFKGGWKPGWLDEGRIGSPWAGGPRLALVGFTIPRWRAVSGWSLAPPRGPKPLKRVVPAGGVYFFQVVAGSALELAASWFRSVSDDDQDRRDGFGLAVWGTW